MPPQHCLPITPAEHDHPFSKSLRRMLLSPATNTQLVGGSHVLKEMQRHYAAMIIRERMKQARITGMM